MLLFVKNVLPFNMLPTSEHRLVVIWSVKLAMEVMLHLQALQFQQALLHQLDTEALQALQFQAEEQAKEVHQEDHVLVESEQLDHQDHQDRTEIMAKMVMQDQTETMEAMHLQVKPQQPQISASIVHQAQQDQPAMLDQKDQMVNQVHQEMMAPQDKDQDPAQQDHQDLQEAQETQEVQVNQDKLEPSVMFQELQAQLDQPDHQDNQDQADNQEAQDHLNQDHQDQLEMLDHQGLTEMQELQDNQEVTVKPEAEVAVTIVHHHVLHQDIKSSCLLNIDNKVVAMLRNLIMSFMFISFKTKK